jgi:hypothetical protein
MPWRNLFCGLARFVARPRNGVALLRMTWLCRLTLRQEVSKREVALLRVRFNSGQLDRVNP